METEEYEHTYAKQEQCLTYELVPVLKTKKEVRTVDFVFFNIFIYHIYCNLIEQPIMMC